jgi:hypothetical protein
LAHNSGVRHALRKLCAAAKFGVSATANTNAESQRFDLRNVASQVPPRLRATILTCGGARHNACDAPEAHLDDRGSTAPRSNPIKAILFRDRFMRSPSESYFLTLVAAFVLLVPGQGVAQESRMRVCTKEYLANKAAIEARGLTEKDYVADCMLRPASAAAPSAASPAAAPSTPAAAASATPAPPAPAAAPAAKTLPWVVVASSGVAAEARLGGYEDKEKCEAAAKAIRLNLKKAAEAAKIECVAGGALAANGLK